MDESYLSELSESEKAVLGHSLLWSGCSAQEIAMSLKQDLEEVKEALQYLENLGLVSYSNPQLKQQVKGVVEVIKEKHIWKLTTDGMRLIRRL